MKWLCPSLSFQKIWTFRSFQDPKPPKWGWVSLLPITWTWLPFQLLLGPLSGSIAKGRCAPWGHPVFHTCVDTGGYHTTLGRNRDTKRCPWHHIIVGGIDQCIHIYVLYHPNFANLGLATLEVNLQKKMCWNMWVEQKSVKKSATKKSEGFQLPTTLANSTIFSRFLLTCFQYVPLIPAKKMLRKRFWDQAVGIWFSRRGLTPQDPSCDWPSPSFHHAFDDDLISSFISFIMVSRIAGSKMLLIYYDIEQNRYQQKGCLGKLLLGQKK